MNDQNLKPSSNESERQSTGLLPCPFCGRTVDYQGSKKHGFRVLCIQADCPSPITPHFKTLRKAINMWNSRAGNEDTAIAVLLDESKIGNAAMTLLERVRLLDIKRLEALEGHPIVTLAKQWGHAKAEVFRFGREEYARKMSPLYQQEHQLSPDDTASLQARVREQMDELNNAEHKAQWALYEKLKAMGL